MDATAGGDGDGGIRGADFRFIQADLRVQAALQKLEAARCARARRQSEQQQVRQAMVRRHRQKRATMRQQDFENNAGAGMWFSNGRTACPSLHQNRPKLQVPRSLAASGHPPYSPGFTRGAEGLYPLARCLPPVACEPQPDWSDPTRSPLSRVLSSPYYSEDPTMSRSPTKLRMQMHTNVDLRTTLRGTVTPAFEKGKAMPLDATHDLLLLRLRNALPIAPSCGVWPRPQVSSSALR